MPITVQISGDVTALNTAFTQAQSTIDQRMRNIERRLDEGTQATQRFSERTAKHLANLEQGFNRIQGTIHQMIGVLATISAATGLERMAQTALQTAASFENLDIRLQLLTKSMADFQQAKQFIISFTAETPFQLAEVSQAFIQLSARGLDAQRAMRGIGDAAAYTGGSAAQLEAVTRAIVQIADRGKLVQQELNQLASAGIPNLVTRVREELKAMGVAVSSDIGSANISALKAIEAVMRVFEKDFKGAMDAIAGSWNVLISNMKDLWSVFVDSVVRGPLLDWLRGVAIVINDVLGGAIKNNQATFQAWGETVVIWIETVIRNFAKLAEGVKPVIAVFQSIITFLQDFDRQTNIIIGKTLGGVAKGLESALAPAITVDAVRRAAAALEQSNTGELFLKSVLPEKGETIQSIDEILATIRERVAKANAERDRVIALAQAANAKRQKDAGDPAQAAAKEHEIEVLKNASKAWIGLADDIKEVDIALKALRSFDVESLQALQLDPFAPDFEQQWNKAEAFLLKRQKDLRDKQAGIDKGAAARAVQESGQSAVEIAKAREDALATSFKREEQMIKQSADERRRMIDETAAAELAAQGPGAVEAIAAKRLQDLRAITVEEAKLQEAAGLRTLEQSAKLREAILQAEIAGAGKNLSAATKAKEELLNLDADTEAQRVKIRAQTEDALQKVSKKGTDEQIEQARAMNKIIQEIEQDRISARINLVDEQIALIKSQMDGEVITTQQGLAQIQALEQQRFDDIRLKYEQEAQIAIDAVNARVDHEQTAAIEIAKIREGLTAQLASVNVQQQTQQQAHLNELSRGWREWVNDVRGALGDFLFRWMDGQVHGIKDLLNDLKSYFFRLIADMVAYAATRAIVIPIVTAVLGGGGGVTGTLGQVATGAGLLSQFFGGGTGGGSGMMDMGGSALGGLGLANQVNSLFGQSSPLSTALTFLTDKFWAAINGLDSLIETNAALTASMESSALADVTGGAMGSSAAGASATLGVAGGLAAIGAGIYGALNASNNAAKAAYAASAAAGAAAASIAVLTAAGVVAAGTGWTGIGLIVAAVMAVIGTVLNMVIKPAGPNLAVGQPAGIGVGEDAGKLVVRGQATSNIIREEGVSPEQTSAVQQALNAGITSAVTSIIQTINAVALDPAKLLGPTQDALRHALAEVQTINSASARHMEKDIAEQLRFTNTAIIANMLDPVNMAFEQLIDSDLKTQLDRLPVTTIGLVEIFKTLNTQLDEMAKGENRDVLGQIQGTREAVARFGQRLAETAGRTAEQIVNGVIKEFDDAIARTQPLKLVSDFSHNLATLITTFNERMTDGLTALVSLQKTQKTLEDAGLSGAGVGSQVDRLTKELSQQGEIFSTRIVTDALKNLSSDLNRIVVQPITIQATTVDSLFTDSLAALNSLWLEWHRLADVGIDTTRIQEQFTKLLGGILDSSKKLLTDALQQGTFPEFLDVLLSIPDALAKLNPVFEHLKALGQAFAQVVGPIQQAISQGEESLRTPTERVDRTAQQMRELEAAIADAGTSAEKALPLYAQLAEAITANAAAQIAAVQQIGAVITATQALLDRDLTTTQRLTRVNQQIADLNLQAIKGRPDYMPPPINDLSLPPPWLRPFEQALEDVTPPPRSIEDLTRLTDLYGQQLDLLGQLIDAIDAGLASIDETLRADETVGQRAARLVAAVTPRPDMLMPAIEASPEALLRQASALQEAIGAVRELIDAIEQGLQNIADILHANETVAERAVRLISSIPTTAGVTDPSALIAIAGQIGEALTAVREVINAIQQGLQQIQDILHATETVTARAVRLVAAVPSIQGVTDPEALIAIAGQMGEALTAVRALTDMLQGGIDSIDATLFGLLSVAEQSADLQAKIAATNTEIASTGQATPEQLITLVGLTQQALSLQQQMTQALESTLADLQSSFVTTPSPAVQLTNTREQIATLQAVADTGAATPEQLQKLVDLNQQLLGLGEQFDLLDVQQEALDALQALAPVIQAQIDESKAREQMLIDSLVAIRGQLEAYLTVAQSTEAQLLNQLVLIQQQLEAYLALAQSTEAQLVGQLTLIQAQLEVALAQAKSTEAQLVAQLTQVQILLQEQLRMAENAELVTRDLLQKQLDQLNAQLLAQYGTINIQDIVRKIQEDALAELRLLNERLKDLFLQQPEAQALFGIQTTLTGQTTQMDAQTGHLRSMDAELNTVINKLDEVNHSLNTPLRTVPAMQGGFVTLQMGGLLDKASLNRAMTGPLGYARGGLVNAILEPGELVFPPPFTPSQTHALTAINTAFPRMADGGWMVPGSGDGDHVPATLTEGSFVLNRKAAQVWASVPALHVPVPALFMHASGGWIASTSPTATHQPPMRSMTTYPFSTRAMGQLGYQDGGFVGGPTAETAKASTTTHVTINIQVVQREGQSGRELVEEIRRQLRREFRSSNDLGPFK